MAFFALSDPLLIGISTSAVASLAFYVAFAAGQFNLSQAGFMAIGAYAAAMATTGGQPAIYGVLYGILISAVLGGLLSLITSKLAGIYLAMATLAFVQVVEQVIYLTPSLNGPMGIYGIPLLLTASQCILILVVIAYVVSRLMKSQMGYEMRILREDPIVARGIGINEMGVRLFSGVATAVLASIAGAMKALTTSYISPEEFSFGLLIQILSFAVIGGTDRFWGPIIGTIVLVMLPEYTRAFQEYRMVLTGVVIVAVIVLFPEGIAGALLRFNQMLRGHWLRKYASKAEVSHPEQTVISTLPRLTIAPKLICEGRNLERRFGGVLAVDDVSLELSSGTVHGLIGPNGAGKSTLVDLLSGEQPTALGKINLDGIEITELPAFMRARARVVRTFQHTRVTQNITAREVVFSGCLMAMRPGSFGFMLWLPASREAYRLAIAQADQILARLDLSYAAYRYVRDLGWEEQRRLEIARAIALRPRVLLLDEPTAGMHASSLPAFATLVRSLAADGMAVLLIEHNVPFIRSTVDHLYAMDSGRMVASGKPNDVLANKTVIDSYLGARSQ